MTSWFDRGAQRYFLQQLMEHGMGSSMPIAELAEGRDRERALFNLEYLRQHGLITISSYEAQITVSGLDLLAGDGGCTAIIGFDNPSMHVDRLKHLLESRVASAGNLSSEQKRVMLNKVRSLPPDCLQALAAQLAELALDQSGVALPLLAKWLGALNLAQPPVPPQEKREPATLWGGLN